MTFRWEKHIVSDNAGQPLEVWRCGDFELARNVNLGEEGGWVFELTQNGRRSGLFGTLAQGKRSVGPDGNLAAVNGATEPDIVEQPPC